MKKHYKFEIDCANCAAKVEDAITVSYTHLTLPTTSRV